LPPLVKVKGLTFKYVTAKAAALQDISFQCQQGRVRVHNRPERLRQVNPGPYPRRVHTPYVPRQLGGRRFLLTAITTKRHVTWSPCRNSGPGTARPGSSVVHFDAVIDEVAFGPENLVPPSERNPRPCKMGFGRHRRHNLVAQKCLYPFRRRETACCRCFSACHDSQTPYPG